MIAYKLVSQSMTTYGNTEWVKGVSVQAKHPGNKMCSNKVLHCYSNPYLAVLLNPIHADISNPRLIEVECSPIIANDGLKQACKTQTMLREIPIPVITMLQKVEFAIKVAMLQYSEPSFVLWANNWIAGKDRSYAAAAARAAAAAAAAAAHEAAAAARAAAAAARYAAVAAHDAAAARAAAAAAHAAAAARYAAAAAAHDAVAAHEAAAARYAIVAYHSQLIQIITEIMEK